MSTGQVDPLAGRPGSTEVDGTTVAWERWPARGTGPVGTPRVLVHGTSAHSAWWHHTVPWLDDGHDVVAVDLSGHGESGRRAAYSLGQWSREVAAVVDDVLAGADAAGRVELVGHSIGGLVAAGAASLRPDTVAALVLVDCLVADPVGEARRPPPVRPAVVHPTQEAALARYRLMPPQPVPDPAVLDYVARRSLRRSGEGWTWKVDPAIFGALAADHLTAALAGVRCPTAVVRGELSPLVGPDAGATLTALLGAPVAQHDVPHAHHHVMLDQGDPFGRLLRRALDDLGARTSESQEATRP